MDQDSERSEQAREALRVCVHTRKSIDAFIRMCEKEQENQNPEETAKLFEHLFNCDNAWAVKALTGNRSGSGLCKKKLLQLANLINAESRNKGPRNFHWPVVDHVARVAGPNILARLLRAREKLFGKPDTTPHYEFMRRELEQYKTTRRK